MAKPSLFYASPLPRQQSGIAIYSHWMIDALSEYFDLTLYTADRGPLDNSLKRFPLLLHGRDPVDFESFDYRLYQIGNNPWFHDYIYAACLKYPGWVVLHESVLYFLVVGLYRDRPDFYRRIYRIGGAPAVAVLKDLARDREDPLRFRNPEKLPLNAELLHSGNRILVHSEYARKAVARVAPEAEVYRTELAQSIETPPADFSRDEFLARYGIPAGAIVAASFGFVAPTKLNHAVCRAVQRLAESRPEPVYYVMVGEGEYVNSYLGDRIKLTGFVGEEEFDRFLACADLVLNLRYPVMGETSAALLRAFASGKPAVVTDAGWFSELPDDVVLKLDASRPEWIEEHVFEALDIFLDSPAPFQKMGEAAREYVRAIHSPAAVARRYFELLTSAAPRQRTVALTEPYAGTAV